MKLQWRSSSCVFYTLYYLHGDFSSSFHSSQQSSNAWIAQIFTFSLLMSRQTNCSAACFFVAMVVNVSREAGGIRFISRFKSNFPTIKFRMLGISRECLTNTTNSKKFLWKSLCLEFLKVSSWEKSSGWFAEDSKDF